MAASILTTELWLPRPRDEVFPFFADARNLQEITPDWLNFEVLTQGALEMREGLLIDYRLRVHGIPIRWRTRIEVWDPPNRFVDVQLRGPYRLWRHEHTFTERDGGTLCGDRVEYMAPGGPLRGLIERFFVRPDVERIFRHRTDTLKWLFPPSGQVPRGGGASPWGRAPSAARGTA